MPFVANWALEVAFAPLYSRIRRFDMEDSIIGDGSNKSLLSACSTLPRNKSMNFMRRARQVLESGSSFSW